MAEEIVPDFAELRYGELTVEAEGGALADARLEYPDEPKEGPQSHRTARAQVLDGGTLVYLSLTEDGGTRLVISVKAGDASPLDVKWFVERRDGGVPVVNGRPTA
jgi:hypothetical protein